MPRHAAFVRFATLGREGRSNDALVRACRDAGATDAIAFLATGNVVFETTADPEAVAVRARALLRERIGFDQPAHVRPLAALAAAVAHDPFRTDPSPPAQ